MVKNKLISRKISFVLLDVQDRHWSNDQVFGILSHSSVEAFALLKA